MKKFIKLFTYSWLFQTIGKKCIDSYLTQDYTTCFRGIILSISIIISIETYHFTIKIAIPKIKKATYELITRAKIALQ